MHDWDKENVRTLDKRHETYWCYFIRSLMFCDIIDVQIWPWYNATIWQCHISYFVLLYKFNIPINTSYRFHPARVAKCNEIWIWDDVILDRIFFVTTAVLYFILLFVITKTNWRNSVTAILGINDVNDTIPYFRTHCSDTERCLI